MEYNVGDVLRADGELYKIIGKIQYKNIDDHCRWMEYRLKKVTDGDEFWLSIDDAYDEYSISHAAEHVSLDGYKKVDEGTQEVIAVWGRVDVSVGDRASFTEYEDASEEHIISEEMWDDGREVSVGWYLDWNEVNVETNPQAVKNAKASAKNSAKNQGAVINNMTPAQKKKSSAGNKNNKKKKSLLPVFVIAGVVLVILAVIGAATDDTHSIAKYLKNNSASYAYETSITGSGKEKADVYRAVGSSVDLTARDIIRGVDGDVEDVQQNSEDGDDSIAILTDDEYCLIYTSEDNEVLVQISSRAYVYRSDNRPYRCHARTYHYYRGFYYTRGYYRDRSGFGGGNSAYTDYDGGTVNYDTSNEYNTYSSSIRQSSVGSRTSSGGGLSSGK